MSNEAKCPFHHTAGGGTTNTDTATTPDEYWDYS